MKRARQKVLDRAEVVCCTCSGAGDPELKDRWGRALRLEGAQAGLPLSLSAPRAFGGAEERHRSGAAHCIA